MRGRPRSVGWCAAALVALLGLANLAAAQEPKTYFEQIQKTWAVGDVRVTRPLTFRDGLLLAFPGRLHELLHARVGKPQTIMLVVERRSTDDPLPFESGEPFLAPIEVLPKYSYWRDNLPNTPHHGILGGRRHVFRGADFEPASRITKAYVATFALEGRERWARQNGVLAEALLAGVKVLREDAARLLSKQLPLTKALDPEAAAKLGEFVSGDYPHEQRSKVVAAAGAAGLESLAPTFEKLATGDDEVAAAALAALAALGKPRSTEQLLLLTAKPSTAVRGYAYAELGVRVATDEAARAAVVKVLSSEEPAGIRAAAVKGVGRSGDKQAIELLRTALYRGDEASVPAASALAKIGGPESVAILKDAVVNAQAEGMVAAVLGISELAEGCPDCRDYLLGLHETHKEAAVRDLIGIVLELQRKHEH